MMEKKFTASVCTLGCRVNLYESEAIADKLTEIGFEIRTFSDVCDVYIINTCTVTAESDRKSRQMIRRAVKTNPNGRILVCGCHSQIFPQKTAEIDGVDYVCGTLDKMAVVQKAKELAMQGKNNRAEVCCGNPFTAEFEEMEATSQDRTRAFLKIEDGCNNKCSYCIIPKARGRVRSKPVSAVIEEVKKLVDRGYKEIVFVGIETAAYGQGTDYSLIDLLEELEKTEGLERIRLGSIEPAYLKKPIIDRLAKLKKPMPHYHLSLQSGCDRTLNAMRRRYNTRMIADSVSYMREKIPNVTFGSDFIVGFPGETDEDHRNTLEFVHSLEILNSHIFSYSVIPNTEAAERTGHLPENVKSERHAELQKVADDMKKRCIQRFIEEQTVFKVLFETEKDGYWYGHTSNFIYVKVKGDGLGAAEKNVVLKKYNEKDGMTEGELI